MTVQFQYVGMIQLVLNINFKSYLMNEVLLSNFLLRDNFYCIYHFRLFVSHLVNLAEAANANGTTQE